VAFLELMPQKVTNSRQTFESPFVIKFETSIVFLIVLQTAV